MAALSPSRPSEGFRGIIWANPIRCEPDHSRTSPADYDGMTLDETRP
jgi:hypothetical protein